MTDKVKDVSEVTFGQVKRILSPDEQKDREQLEMTIELAFYHAGRALKEIADRRLFRSTHKTFDEYCRDRFGFGRDAANLKINASIVYDNIKRMLPADNDVVPLPTNENQLRSISKAKLSAGEQAEVWVKAVEVADGLPTGRLVQEIVERFKTDTTQAVTLKKGDVCTITANGNSVLSGKGGCWCIVSEVSEFDCKVITWDEEYELKQDYLSPLPYSNAQKQHMQTILARMKKLSGASKNDASQWILKWIARIDRPHLDDIEEKFLSLIESEYLKK